MTDGYGDKRVAVMSMGTAGRSSGYRHRTSNKPSDANLGPWIATAPPAQQFRNPVHCAEMQNDRLVLPDGGGAAGTVPYVLLSAKAACRLPGWWPAQSDRADRLALGRRPGDRRRHSDGRRDDAVPVGLRLGRPRHPVARSSGRSGTSSTRSRRSTTSAPSAVRRARRPRLGDRRLSARARAAGPPSSGFAFFVWLELVGTARPALAVHRPGRLHRVHARDDGPVRARRLARQRRDVQRLVRAARPACAVRPVGDPADGRVARRPFASGLLLPGWRLEDLILVGVRDRVDPLRRPVPDPALVRGVRRAGRPDQDAPARRLPRRVVLAAFLVSRLVGVAGDRGRPAADRRRLPRRPLLHVPADRRAADHRRARRPVPAGLGYRQLRLGVLPADVGVPATGLRLDDPARGRRRRPHARRVGGPCRRRARDGAARGAPAHRRGRSRSR